MSVEEEGFVHKLYISSPTTDDEGKYGCDINNIGTSAYLTVDGKLVTKNTLFITQYKNSKQT
jgi:hypothetical protein